MTKISIRRTVRERAQRLKGTAASGERLAPMTIDLVNAKPWRFEDVCQPTDSAPSGTIFCRRGRAVHQGQSAPATAAGWRGLDPEGCLWPRQGRRFVDPQGYCRFRPEARMRDAGSGVGAANGSAGTGQPAGISAVSGIPRSSTSPSRASSQNPGGHRLSADPGRARHGRGLL